jgi:hypothetical protein
MVYLRGFVKLRIINNLGWIYGHEALAYRQAGTEGLFKKQVYQDTNVSVD